MLTPRIAASAAACEQMDTNRYKPTSPFITHRPLYVPYICQTKGYTGIHQIPAVASGMSWPRTYTSGRKSGRNYW